VSYAARPMGDYKTYGYAGDPGFLSSLWKGFTKVAKFIPGPIGMVAKIAGGAALAFGGAKAVQTVQQAYKGPLGAPQFPQVSTFPGGTMTQFGPRVPAVGGPQFKLPGPGVMGAPGQPCPTGYHLAKDGSGRWVRNRRMNIANPRALRRAMRRVGGFEKLAKRTISFTRRVKMKTRKS